MKKETDEQLNGAFRCAVKSLMCDFSIFFMWSFSAMNFPLSTAFIVSNQFDFSLVDLSIVESGVLKSPTTSVWGLMCYLSFSNVSFTNVGIFLLVLSVGLGLRIDVLCYDFFGFSVFFD
ncbi:hypothetical protein STEG23_025711 [Scotinomys teguina]